jgi:hypothetical protein
MYQLSPGSFSEISEISGFSAFDAKVESLQQNPA